MYWKQNKNDDALPDTIEHDWTIQDELFITIFINVQIQIWIIVFTIIKGLGGFKNFKKSIFFCLFNNTVCLEYSLLYGAGIDDSM